MVVQERSISLLRTQTMFSNVLTLSSNSWQRRLSSTTLGGTDGTGQRGEGGGQGRGTRALHGSCTPRAQLAHLQLQVPEGLVELLKLVAGNLQALWLQALQAHLDAHDEMQEKVEVLIGALALMVNPMTNNTDKVMRRKMGFQKMMPKTTW
ncbi:hypothetical protein INR49_005230 [Caranx melampygus]|nr:hypothetical protein INR49_005230 [Caranx melampygus]